MTDQPSDPSPTDYLLLALVLLLGLAVAGAWIVLGLSNLVLIGPPY